MSTFAVNSSLSIPILSSPQTPDEIISYWEQKDNENRYLEEVLGDNALKFVNERNDHILNLLGSPKDASNNSNSNELYNRILSILDSKDKIPYISKYGNYYYNFWQDENHKRGIYRRTSYESYISENTQWELVIDIDLLGLNENESWVYKGIDIYQPEDITIPIKYALVYLSRGGSDATIIREFNLETLLFVETDNKFYLPEAKSSVHWKTPDILWVGTDLHDDNSLTDSGYPRVIREWIRGTEIVNAPIIFEGDKTDVSVNGYITRHTCYKVEILSRSLTFYTSKKFIKLDFPNNTEFQTNFIELIDFPADAQFGQYLDQILIKLRSDWIVNDNVLYKQGSLITTSFIDFLKNGKNSNYKILFNPTNDRISLKGYTITKSYVIVELLDNVKEKFQFYQLINGNEWILNGEETGFSFCSLN